VCSEIPVQVSLLASRKLVLSVAVALIQRPRVLSAFVFAVSKRSVLHHARSLCVHVSHLHSSSFPSSSPTHFSLLKCLGLPLLIFPLVVRVRVRLTEVHTLRGPHIRIITVPTLTGATGTRGTEKEHMSWNGTAPCTITVAVVVAEVQMMVCRV